MLASFAKRSRSCFSCHYLFHTTHTVALSHSALLLAGASAANPPILRKLGNNSALECPLSTFDVAAPINFVNDFTKPFCPNEGSEQCKFNWDGAPDSNRESYATCGSLGFKITPTTPTTAAPLSFTFTAPGITVTKVYVKSGGDSGNVCVVSLLLHYQLMRFGSCDIMLLHLLITLHSLLQHTSCADTPCTCCCCLLTHQDSAPAAGDVSKAYAINKGLSGVIICYTPCAANSACSTNGVQRAGAGCYDGGMCSAAGACLQKYRAQDASCTDDVTAAITAGAAANCADAGWCKAAAAAATVAVSSDATVTALTAATTARTCVQKYTTTPRSCAVGINGSAGVASSASDDCKNGGLCSTATATLGTCVQQYKAKTETCFAGVTTAGQCDADSKCTAAAPDADTAGSTTLLRTCVQGFKPATVCCASATPAATTCQKQRCSGTAERLCAAIADDGKDGFDCVASELPGTVTAPTGPAAVCTSLKCSAGVCGLTPKYTAADVSAPGYVADVCRDKVVNADCDLADVCKADSMDCIDKIKTTADVCRFRQNACDAIESCTSPTETFTATDLDVIAALKACPVDMCQGGTAVGPSCSGNMAATQLVCKANGDYTA
jgi:hypothetical protein